METGKPIWVESCMTKEEWKARYREGYPSSTVSEPPAEFDCEFKWRKGMGSKLTADEINRINARIDYLLESACLIKAEIEKE